MNQFNNASWQDATNQLKFAEQNIIQVQQKMQSAANDPHPQEQFLLQQALGAVCHAKDIINGTINASGGSGSSSWR